MKLYSEYASASIRMAESAILGDLLCEVIKTTPVTHVIETGTYDGLGSTTFIAKAFPPAAPPDVFLTIEINWHSWLRAKSNLQRFPFVTPVWGRTVPVKRALEFIQTDDALLHHREYPEVFIDDIEDPIRFYRDELLGHLEGHRTAPGERLRRWSDRIFKHAGNNLLEKYLRQFCSYRPLIVLDSAGAVGLLEFSIVEQIMRAHPYVLLLDDIHHVKHFRSLQRIESDERFRIMHLDRSDGWVLAWHGPLRDE